MGLFSYKNKQKYAQNKFLYILNYSSFLKYFKYPIPTDYVFGLLLLGSISNKNYGLILTFSLAIIFLKILMYVTIERKKIVLTKEYFSCTLGAQKLFF